MMSSTLNFWYFLMPILLLAVGAFSSLNVVIRHNGRPRFTFKQVVFDGLAVIATVFNTYLMFSESWLGMVQFAQDHLPGREDILRVWIFSALAIVAINAVYFIILRYVSIGVQEIKYSYLHRNYERRMRIKRHRQMVKELELQKDPTLKAIERILEEDLETFNRQQLEKERAAKKAEKAEKAERAKAAKAKRAEDTENTEDENKRKIINFPHLRKMS